MRSPDQTGDGSLMDDSAVTTDDPGAELPLEDTKAEGMILEHLEDLFME